MTNEKRDELLTLLRQAFESAGASFNSLEVQSFFCRKRKICPSTEEYDEKNNKVYSYSPLIEPILLKITPLQFENCGYMSEDITTALDWFLYENAGSNPLVWNNIGKPSFDIKSSFEEARKSKGPIKISINNMVFNGGDGNHRLLTLMINQLIERTAAKTSEEKQAIDKKYEMTLRAKLPFSIDLVQALEEENSRISEYNKESNIPLSVRKYRAYMPNIKDYLAKYNPTTHMFEYSFNGENFRGSEKELLNFLETKTKTYDPIMIWDCDGYYYASCYNKVYKSKDEKKINEILPKLREYYRQEKLDNNPYLEIKDVDVNKYELRTDYYNCSDRETSKELSKFLLEFIKERETIMAYKSHVNLKQLEEKCKRILDFNIDFYLDEQVFKDLSKEELQKIKEVINVQIEVMEEIKHAHEDKV